MKEGVRLISSVQTPAALRVTASRPLQLCFTQRSLPACDCSIQGLKISQLHLFNFLFLDVQESINEKLAPHPTSNVSAQRWLQ